MNKIDQEMIYAGVLGKIIGVYLGRPVEGWSYDKISKQFGQILYYVNDKTKAPLIVPDDDISGTFTFVRSLADNQCRRSIQSRAIGNSWLNYIIEDQTILWFGGLSRSTEHTAYLRLKQGIEAPRSGSIELNGSAMATQIGAEIFVDSWAMLCPGDPDLATYLARESSRVSHDGIAVEAACFLAAMEAMAFREQSIDTLLDEGLNYVSDNQLLRIVDEIRTVCAQNTDWLRVRDYIAKYHGYDKYLGNCPMVTNHLVVLMSLIMGKNSFQNSISIAVSSGWDTDCNAGNIGCLNGIRLGLHGIDAAADFRTPVADRMLVVSSDGGSCITDAVIESRKLIQMSEALYSQSCDELLPRFGFDFSGSLQGFQKHPDRGLEQAVSMLSNTMDNDGKAGLRIDFLHLAKGMVASVCTDTFTDLQPKGKDGTSYFEVYASPSLYPTQTVCAVLQGDAVPVEVCLFVEYYNDDASLTLARSPWKLLEGKNPLQIVWETPDTNGFPIYRIGVEIQSEARHDGFIVLRSLNWDGAPRNFLMGKSYEMTPQLTPWTTSTIWLKTFMSSARNFCPDYTTTFSISHPEPFGVVTIGTEDWMDYSVSSTLLLLQQKGSGLVGRAKGHRRYYAAIIRDGVLMLLRQCEDEMTVLAQHDGNYSIDKKYDICLEMKGNDLKVILASQVVLQATDSLYSRGGAGFLVDSGAMLADGFVIKKI